MTTTPRQPLFCAHADTNGDPGRCACGQQLADVGPATPPPPWCEPGTEPIWEADGTSAGQPCCRPTRFRRGALSPAAMAGWRLVRLWVNDGLLSPWKMM